MTEAQDLRVPLAVLHRPPHPHPSTTSVAARRATAAEHRHTPGTYRLRVRNLPAVYAHRSPAYDQLMARLFWEHTGVAIFDPTTNRTWLNKDHTQAWGFVEVHSATDGEALIDRAHHVVVNRLPWEVAWTYDSLPAILAMLDPVTNPAYQQLSSYYHIDFGLTRVRNHHDNTEVPRAEGPPFRHPAPTPASLPPALALSTLSSCVLLASFIPPFSPPSLPLAFRPVTPPLSFAPCTVSTLQSPPACCLPPEPP